MWLKGLKFTLPYSLRENLSKMMHPWYMSPEKLPKTYITVLQTIVATVESMK